MTPRIVDNPPAPGTAEWRGMITASKVPALLSVSRFKPRYSMWMEMAGRVEPEPFDAERGAWGHIAELSLAEWWKLRHPGWLLNQGGEVAYTDPDLPFPNLVTLDRRAYNKHRPKNRCFHIVECKTAFNMDGWGDVGMDDAIPNDYYTQVLFQMGVSGIHEASIVVQGPSPEPEIHEVPWDETMFRGIVQEMEKNYISIRDGIEPDWEKELALFDRFGLASPYEKMEYTMRNLHPDIERGEEIQLDMDTAVRILDAVQAVEDAKRAEFEEKMRLMEAMGNAQYAMVGDVKIADRRSRKGNTPYVQINKKANLEG